MAYNERICYWTTKFSTLWWSVNLSDNWAFNVWTVNLIKTLTIILFVFCYVKSILYSFHPITIKDLFKSGIVGGETISIQMDICF